MRFNDPPTAEDFEFALGRRLLLARGKGEIDLTITAGDLHKEVGGYPGSNHRMPVCCSVLRKTMKDDDEILDKPPSGKGASLQVRYRIS